MPQLYATGFADRPTSEAQAACAQGGALLHERRTRTCLGCTVVVPWHHTGDAERKLTPDELIKTLQMEIKTCRVRTKDTTTTQNIGDENPTDDGVNPTPTQLLTPTTTLTLSTLTNLNPE